MRNRERLLSLSMSQLNSIFLHTVSAPVFNHQSVNNIFLSHHSSQSNPSNTVNGDKRYVLTFETEGALNWRVQMTRPGVVKQWRQTLCLCTFFSFLPKVMTQFKWRLETIFFLEIKRVETRGRDVNGMNVSQLHLNYFFRLRKISDLEHSQVNI